ncbi:ABC transporter ATP-binding protein [Escherichia coli]|uniref:ABC transporter ATP-binding protein n=1 Tax=Escherichia coli TaxID=562 RepID=A0A2X3LQV1_ECOLX|nr:ABC transporter ATP-binding protein [Escherichia coli]STJ27333.1 ABC transporter ATP-binding protein [Escherichia coli]
MEQSVANLVDMRDVSFTRGNRCIFDNISLTVPRGKITAIMGHRASVKRRYSV